MIDPRIWNDEGFNKLSHSARLLWFGFISHADDYGRGYADVQYWKNNVFGYDKISLKMVEKWLAEIKKHMKNVLIYPQKSKKYYQLMKWKSYQNIRIDRIRPSHIPPPPVRQVSDKRQQNDGIDKYSIDKIRIDKSRGDDANNNIIKGKVKDLKDKMSFPI